MEETKRADVEQLREIIEWNCKQKHSGALLPENPYFLMRSSDNSEISAVLKDLLRRSNREIRAFSENVARVLVELEDEKRKEHELYASNMRSIVDIREGLRELERIPDEGLSTMKLEIFTAESQNRPVVVKFSYKGNSYAMPAKETVELQGTISDHISLQFFCNDNGEEKLLGDRVVQFESTLDSTDLLTAINNDTYSTIVNEKQLTFTVTMKFSARLSKSDRVIVLTQLLIVCEKQRDEGKKDNYIPMLEALKIEKSGEDYVTCMSSARERSSAFCDSCALL